MITTLKQPKNFYVDKGTEFTGEFRKFLQSWRIMVLEIYTIPLSEKIWIRKHSQIDSNFHNPDFQKKNAR